jgi:hypothetical protein
VIVIVIAIENEIDMKVVMKTDILHPIIIEIVRVDMAVVLKNEEVQVPPLHLVNLESQQEEEEEEEEDLPAINNLWIPQPQPV